MRIINCQNVKDELIYDVFKRGYSDYFFEFTMTMEVFVSRFLENEADRKLSFIALDGDNAVGLVLGNIKNYHGVRTMRHSIVF